jgi:hypothetical protein
MNDLRFWRHNLIDQASMIKGLCRRAGIPRHSTAPKRLFPLEKPD